MDINISRELCHFGHNAQHQRYDATEDITTQNASFNRSTSSSASPLSSSASPPQAARRVSRTSVSAGSILKPVAEPLAKRCLRIFFEDGLESALREAATTGPPQPSSASAMQRARRQLHSEEEDDTDANAEEMHTCGRLLVARLAGTALRLIDVLGRAQLYVQPQQRAATVALNPCGCRRRAIGSAA